MGEVPEGHYTVPLESAAVFRTGADVTVLTYGTMVFVGEAAASESGVDAEIVDLRSLWPLDLPAIVESVKKTRRCVVVHEATRTSGFGAELVALCRSTASITSRRRSSASPAGTRRIRTRSSGRTSRARTASPPRSSA